MNDNISRQAAIDVVSRPICPTGNATYDNAREAERESIREELEQLTSADRRGEWIYCEDNDGNDGYRCDKCGYHVPWDYTRKSIHFIEEYNFCPHCGADMRGVDDESTI